MFTNLKNTRMVATCCIAAAFITLALPRLAIAQQLPAVPNPTNTTWFPVDPPIDVDYWWWQGSSQQVAIGTICFSAPGASLACTTTSSSITIAQGTQLSGGVSFGIGSINVGKTFATEQKFILQGQACKNCELFLCYPNAALFEYVNISNTTGNIWITHSLSTGGATAAANTKCVDARAWCCSLGNQECCDDSTECDGSGEGDCLEANGTPGCEDAECCSSVCPIDPMCCQVAWDELCATIAGDLCYPSDQPVEEEESSVVLIIDLASSNQDEPNLSLWNLTEQQQCELEQVVRMQINAAPQGQYEELVIFDSDQTVYFFDLLGDFQLFGHIDRDNFDSYAAGTQLHGVNGWKGWDNDPAFSAPVTSAQSNSPSQSLDISGDADLVHEYCEIDVNEFPGQGWFCSTWQYIPSDFQSGGNGQFAGSYFIVLNTYEDGGPYNWSVQMQFDSNDGMLKVYYGDGTNTIDVPYIVDQWVPIEVIIDLNNDWTQVYYDHQLIAEYSWTGGALGEGGGALEIAAVDFYAKGSSSIFYDDFLIEYLGNPSQPCPADLDGNGSVGTSDLLALFAAWGTNPGGPPDLDGAVSTSDILVLFSQWGPCP